MVKTVRLSTYGPMKTVMIGRLGEYGITKLEIDISEYTQQYGEATASCVAAVSANDLAFPIESSQDGNIVSIDINEAITQHRTLYLETRMFTADGLAKGETIVLHSIEALKDGADAPDIYKSWIIKAENLLESLKDFDLPVDKIEQIFIDYITENPIQTVSEARVKEIVESYGYVTEDDIPTDAHINSLIDTRLIPIAALAKEIEEVVG